MRQRTGPRQTWIAYNADSDEWKVVSASSADDAAEAAERATDEPDSSDSWEAAWTVAEAPDDFDDKNPSFPDPDEFEGKKVTVSVTKEIKYTYTVSR